MTTYTNKQKQIQFIIEEILAGISFLFLFFFFFSWAGVISEQPLPSWNFFSIILTLSLNLS